MDCRKFNSTMSGYIIYAMENAGFSYSDIEKMLIIIDRYGKEFLTLEQAYEYRLKIWDGEIDFSEAESRENRILERKE